MNIPGLKDVEITKIEEVADRIALYLQLQNSLFIDKYQHYSKE